MDSAYVRILELLNIEDNPTRRVEKYKIIIDGRIQTAEWRNEQLGKYLVTEWSITHTRTTRKATELETKLLGASREIYRDIMIDRYFRLILALPLVRDIQRVIWGYYSAMPMGKGNVGWKVIQYDEVKPNWTMRGQVNDWIILNEPGRWVTADVYYLKYVEGAGKKEVCNRCDFDRMIKSAGYKLETVDYHKYWRR